MKIEKDKPLPDHTKLKYEECYAKAFLEFFLSDSFFNLRIEDKPDLYDSNGDIGIEVTDCTDQKHKEAVKLWYMIPYVSKNKRQRNIDRMKQLGVEYQGGVQTWQTIVYDNGIDSSVYSSLFSSLKSKLKKLNTIGLYKPCKEYHLFIYSELWFSEEWKQQLAKKISNISSSYQRKYNTVYIATQDEFLCIDIESMNVNSFDTCDFQFDLAHKARKMVEDGEENE